MKKFLLIIETLILPASAAAAFAMGLWGYVAYRPDLGFTDQFQATVRLYAMMLAYNPDATVSIPWMLTLARWLAPMALFIAVLKTYLAVTANYRRLLALGLARRHAVVCGLGERGMLIVTQLRAQKKRVVVIESDPNSAAAGAGRIAGAIVIAGNATSAGVLEKAGVARAAELHIALGDDSQAIACAIEAHRLCKAGRRARDGRLDCQAHVQGARSRELFKAHSLFAGGAGLFCPRIIDDNRLAARQALIAFAGIMLAPARAAGEPPHIVVAGAGCAGQALLVQMAHILHPGSGKPLRITVLDEQAARRESEFACRYPFIHDGEFIRPRFINGNISRCDAGLIALMKGEPAREIDGVFLCIGDEMEALSAALLMRRHLDRKTPIAVCTATGAGLSELFKDKAVQNYNAQNIHIHNLTRSACEQLGATGEAIERMAMALHRDYYEREKARAAPGAFNENFTGWENLSEFTRESNRNQAADLFLKLACLGHTFARRDAGDSPSAPEGAREAVEPLYASGQLEVLGQMEHRRWMMDKFLDGWVRGPKVPGLRQNPHLKPWEELDAQIKAYDIEPVAATLRLLTASGYAVYSF